MNYSYIIKWLGTIGWEKSTKLIIEQKQKNLSGNTI